jgi:thioredoxin 1
MRIALACLLLFIVPPLLVFAIREYEAQKAPPAMDLSQMKSSGEVLFFNASWCGPCRQMKPIVAQLKREGYHFRDIDVDKNRALAQKFKVRGIPTFVFVQNGSEIHRFSGGTSPENLRKQCADPMYH